MSRQEWEVVGHAVQDGLAKGIEEGAARAERDPAYTGWSWIRWRAAASTGWVLIQLGAVMDGAPVTFGALTVGRVEDGLVVITHPAALARLRAGSALAVSVGPVSAPGSTEVYYREPPEMP